MTSPGLAYTACETSFIAPFLSRVPTPSQQRASAFGDEVPLLESVLLFPKHLEPKEKQRKRHEPRALFHVVCGRHGKEKQKRRLRPHTSPHLLLLRTGWGQSSLPQLRGDDALAAHPSKVGQVCMPTGYV
jgi:hypothetical protein